MTRSKKLGMLLGILVVICVATLILTQIEEKKEEIKNSEETILEIATEDVRKISWECSSDKLTFHRKEDEKWIYEEDEKFPVNETKMNEILSIFNEFGVSFVIENVKDYGQYGLENPVCTVQIETEEETYEVKMGEFSTMDSQRYVSIGDGNVYLVNSDPVETFDIIIDDMLQKDEALVYNKISMIKFKGTETYTVQYLEDAAESLCEDDVYFAKSENETISLDTTLVEDYLGLIVGMDMSSYVTYSATEEELRKYGLDNPELTVTLDYTKDEEEGMYTICVSRNAEEKEEFPDMKDAEAEMYSGYVRIGNSGIIYEITSEDFVALMEMSVNDLRHQELFIGAFEDITKIAITLEGKDHTLTANGKDDEKTWKYGEEEIEISEIKEAFTGLTVDEFSEKEPTGEEEIAVTISLEHDVVSALEFKIYRYNGSDCIAVIDGEPIGYISRSEVVDLIEAVNSVVLD